MSSEATLGRVLASGSVYTIVDEGGVVRCAVMIRPEVTPEQGAQAAKDMTLYLIERVTPRRSPYSGLIFDVRKGPPVFGPVTRAALEEMFQNAERNEKPLAALVQANPIQRMQFASLSREHAGKMSTVVEDDTEARSWIRARHAQAD